MRAHHHHLAETLRLASPREIKLAMDDVRGINAKTAVMVTRGLGSMWCAWSFLLIALLAAPAAFGLGLFPSVVGFAVVWISQCAIQLIALSVLQVAQNNGQVAADARTQKMLNNTEQALDRLDAKTEGGIKEVLDAVNALGKKSVSKKVR
jgi:hypothetical protein